MIKMFFLISLWSVFSSISSNAYEMKIASVPGYSKVWLMVMADRVSVDEIRNIRMHLHGWTQDRNTGAPVNPLFDFEWKNPSTPPTQSGLKKFVESFGIQNEVEKNHDRAVLIPISRGHCDQYPELLNGFDRTFSAVLGSFGLPEDQVKLVHVSAHSGGGEVLSRLLVDSTSRFFTHVKHVTFYDAIYSAGTQNRLMTWILAKKEGLIKSLDLPVITGGSPWVRASDLFDQLSSVESTEFKTVGGYQLKFRAKVLSSFNFVHVVTESKKAPTLDHWTIVKTLWEL